MITIDLDHLPGDEPDLSNAKLFADSNRGIYIPQFFARIVKRECVLAGMDDEQQAILDHGPDHEHYWDVWTEVLDNVVLRDTSGKHWRLWQDGDLWLVPSFMDAKLRSVCKPTTRAQREALRRVFERGPIFREGSADQILAQRGWAFGYTTEPVAWWWERNGERIDRKEAGSLVVALGYAKPISYREFRKRASSPVRAGDPVIVHWAGMWLAIESDGYVHS